MLKRLAVTAQSEMVKSLGEEGWEPEVLIQTFFMPWQDTQGSRISYGGSTPPVRKQEEGLALLRNLGEVAKERVKDGLLPMKVKILINDPKSMVDDRSPGKMSLKTLRKELKRIDPRGVQVEIWGAEARSRDSHHKKMTVVLGGKNSRDEKSGVLVQTGNHDTQKMLDSGVKLTGRDTAVQQRKQFYAETLSSGRLLAINGPSSSRKKIERSSKNEMRRGLEEDPPKNDRNTGNTLMTHQPPNSTLVNQFRLSEPYTLIKAGIQSAQHRVRIVMPYFQLIDVNDEIKGAIARGVDVGIVLSRDEGTQELIGQSNHESADELLAFRKELAEFHGEDGVGKLNVGWFQPQQRGPTDVDAPEFNPSGGNYAHQKLVSIDNEVSIIGSFNTDYRSLHSAEQMVMVPNDENAKRFLDYMVRNTVSHERLPRRENRPLSLQKKIVHSYVGPPSYKRLGLNSRASQRLPINLDKFDRHSIGSIDESIEDSEDLEPNQRNRVYTMNDSSINESDGPN